MAQPLTFDDSYSQFLMYPTQLIHRSSYPFALERNRAQLAEEVSRGLCISDDQETDVIFRDLSSDPAHPVKRNIFSDVELLFWLDYGIALDHPNQAPAVPVLTMFPKHDPVCRFIYLWGGTSRESLKLTRTSLSRILTYHQVMPTYLEFIYCFGVSEKSRELGYSGFREQTLLSDPPCGPTVLDLGRSGRQFQMCYNLKAPYLRTNLDKLWSIRPAAIHHQFDVENGRSIWIITKGDRELKDRIESMTDPAGRPEDRTYTSRESAFNSSLAVHLLVAHWSSEGWRARIKALEDEIDKEFFEAVDASQARGRVRRRYTADDLFELQGNADKTHEAIMVMKANIDVLTATKQYYENLLNNKSFPMKAGCEESVNVFATQLSEMVYDTKMQVSRAELLTQITADRKDMISRRLDSQATESIEGVTPSMYNVGLLSQTEAATMRVVTVLTMLYLPATFVSTFFSTDVVKYQNQNNSGSVSNTGNPTTGSAQGNNRTSFSTLAMERWLEVTLPLTFVTVLIAWYLYEKSKKRIQDITGIEGALPLHNPPMWKDEKV